METSREGGEREVSMRIDTKQTHTISHKITHDYIHTETKKKYLLHRPSKYRAASEKKDNVPGEALEVVLGEDSASK